MSKTVLLSFFISFVILSISCTKKIDGTDKPIEEKDVSELTYQDIYKIALATKHGGGMEFNGETFGQKATEDLSIYADGKCGTKDCGILLVMQNKSAEKGIKAVLKTKFKLPNNPVNEIVRMYQMNAGEVISIGCSHICHQESSYMIQREILSAGYMEVVDIDSIQVN